MSRDANLASEYPAQPIVTRYLNSLPRLLLALHLETMLTAAHYLAQVDQDSVAGVNERYQFPIQFLSCVNLKEFMDRCNLGIEMPVKSSYASC